VTIHLHHTGIPWGQVFGGHLSYPLVDEPANLIVVDRQK